MAAVGVLVLAAARRIWGIDFWWQYTTGRLVAQHGIPQVDTLSYTRAGEPWIELRWLYCWTLYSLENVVGAAGLVVVKTLLLVLTFALVVRSVASRPSTGVTASVLLVGVLCAMPRFFVRPELVSMLGFASFVWLIRGFLAHGDRRLWALPPLQVLWTNAHTVFILGPLLAGLAALVCALRVLWARRGGDDHTAAMRQLRAAAAITLLTIAACLVNPYGVTGALFPFKLYAEMSGSGFKDYIEEFKSPFVFTALAAFDAWIALIVLCGVAAASNLRRLDPFWSILLASQLFLSCVAVRNLPLFALAAIPFVLDNFARSPWLAPPHARRNAWVGSVAALLALSLGGYYGEELWTNRLYRRTGDPNETGFGMARHRYPVRAVEFMERHGMRERVFHTFLEGSYLTAHGIPVFIDPRLEVYTEEQFVAYMQLVQGKGDWTDAVARHRFTVALLDLHSSLVEPALASGWTLRYFDEVAVVLAPRGTFPKARPIREHADFAAEVARLRKLLPPPQPAAWVVGMPQPYLRVAGFLLKRGVPDLARPFLLDARAAYRDTEDIRRGLRLVDETQTQSLDALQRAARERPDDGTAWLRLSWAQLQQADARAAQRSVDRAVQLVPRRSDAWEMRARIAAHLGDGTATIESWRRASQLQPRRVELFVELARAQLHWNQRDAARQSIRQGLRIAPENAELRTLQSSLAKQK